MKKFETVSFSSTVKRFSKSFRGVHVVKLTGNISNECWAEAIIYEWFGAGCPGDKKTGRQWKGWIKAVDNSGAPNIWTFISC
ncbi:MAG: hypothetical protein GY795_08655 [Desulfobacterales bacterium]|nr:hypothetical protein [Desulfobacterales bacterium]